MYELTDEQMDRLEELNKKYGLGFENRFKTNDISKRMMSYDELLVIKQLTV